MLQFSHRCWQRTQLHAFNWVGITKKKSLPLFNKTKAIADADVFGRRGVWKENELWPGPSAAENKVEAIWICNKSGNPFTFLKASVKLSYSSKLFSLCKFWLYIPAGSGKNWHATTTCLRLNYSNLRCVIMTKSLFQASVHHKMFYFSVMITYHTKMCVCIHAIACHSCPSLKLTKI